MDAQRCWAGSRKGARKGVMGEMYGRGRRAEVNRRAFNRGGMAATVSGFRDVVPGRFHNGKRIT